MIDIRDCIACRVRRTCITPHCTSTAAYGSNRCRDCDDSRAEHAEEAAREERLNRQHGREDF